jgi:Zn-dependent protease with chaperone function
MTKLAVRSTVAAAVLSVANVALASGDSGTGSVTEMEVGAGTFFALLGAVVGMMVLVWLVLKLFNRKRK